MAYEVEQRAKLDSKDEFERVKVFLDNNAKFVDKKEMKSFLFREPDYLRIRFVKGKDKFIVTVKKGSYEDKARVETENVFDLDELSSFLDAKKKEGYLECACVHTKRFSYGFMGLTVELSEIDHFGLIVEVEAVTDKKSEIDRINENVGRVLNKLHLEKLAPKIYQKMMDEIYEKSMKSIDEQDFSI